MEITKEEIALFIALLEDERDNSGINSWEESVLLHLTEELEKDWL
jgi:hypothetical protein